MIEKALASSLDLLRRNDADILQIDANERTISHRLAVYLESHFPGWNVDCEYNRYGYEPKRLGIIARRIKSNDIKATTVYPDIIIHRRGTEENLLIIEMKKSTSQQKEYEYDLRKLRAFKQQLGYSFAVFIKIVTTDDNVGIDQIEWIDE